MPSSLQSPFGLPVGGMSGLALYNSSFGGIFNSSVAGGALEYNYCKAHGVAASSYQLPQRAQEQDANLVGLIYVQRHQKRTPDNLVPGRERDFNPAAGWDCSDIDYLTFASQPQRNSSGAATRINAETVIESWHPFARSIWPGSCDQGTLTRGGLDDAIDHGRALWSVYGPEGPAAFLSHPTEDEIYIRTSPAPRTYQVSGGLLTGMGRNESHGSFAVHAQPSTIDNIVPSCSCSYASELRTQIEQEQAWRDHLKSIQPLFDTVNQALGTGNISSWNTWIDHAFDFLASRQCHGHELPAGITQETADAVYQAGTFEYNYIWNASPLADDYVKYSFGAFALELARALQKIEAGDAKRAQLFIGHDGTMVRLLKTLAQSGTIRWPALGSEVVVEVWRTKDAQHFVRMLACGQEMVTLASGLLREDQTSPSVADWTPLGRVVEYLYGRVPDDLVERCTS